MRRFGMVLCFFLSAMLSMTMLCAQELEQLKKQVDESESLIKAKLDAKFSLGIIEKEITFPSGKKAYAHGISPNGKVDYIMDENIRAARSTGVLDIKKGGRVGLGLTGMGRSVGVWEVNTLNANHQELLGRISFRDGSAGGEISSHATHVSGTIAASGINSNAKGMAHKAIVHFYNSDSDESEMISAALGGLKVSNHSYGFIRGWNEGVWFGDESISSEEDYLFGFYDSNARLWDQISYNAPYYLICKSAGNERGDSGAGFPADGDGGAGYDCISHSALAKNVLSVAAVNNVQNYSEPSDVIMSSFSSWGPTDDGRIKPDISAVGVGLFSSGGGSNNTYTTSSGTSMASPNVAGALVLLQELHEDIFNKPILAATLKGLVIHTAKETGTSPGPDYAYGWGLLDAASAAEFMLEEGQANLIRAEDTILNDETWITDFVHTGGEIKATLIWSDIPGSSVVPQLDPMNLMLVNDLDLRLVSTDNQISYPWVLNPSQPGAAATKGDNFRDNVEQIHAILPAGTYQIQINHKNQLIGGAQNFSVMVSGKYTPRRTLYWIGGSGNWSDPNHWSLSSGGASVMELPTIQDRVIFNHESELEAQTVTLDVDASCHSLAIVNEEMSLFKGILNTHLNIQTFFNADNVNAEFEKLNVRMLGNENIGLRALRGGASFEGVRIELLGDGVEWKLEKSTFDYLKVNGSDVKLKAGGLSVDTLIFSNIKSGIVDLAGVNFSNLDYLLVEECDPSNLNLSSVNFSFSSNGTMDIKDNHEVNRVQVSGKLSINNSGLIKQLKVDASSDVTLGEVERIGFFSIETPAIVRVYGDEIIVDQIETTGDSGLEFLGNGSFIGNLSRRFCFSNLNIEDVNVGGSTVWVAGANSSRGQASGWIMDDCENLLFTDFEVASTCAGSMTTFVDLSTGTITDWLWNFGDGQTSTESNPIHSYTESGSYFVELKVSGNGFEEALVKEIVVKSKKNVSLVMSGAILRSGVTAQRYRWFDQRSPEITLSTSAFVTIVNGVQYVLEIFDGECYFRSEPFVITGMVNTDEVKVFPNPVINEICVESIVPIDDLRILSISGNELIREKGPTLDLRKLSEGVYVLIVRYIHGEESAHLIRKQ